jgi:hypothetical protein
MMRRMTLFVCARAHAWPLSSAQPRYHHRHCSTLSMTRWWLRVHCSTWAVTTSTVLSATTWRARACPQPPSRGPICSAAQARRTRRPPPTWCQTSTPTSACEAVRSLPATDRRRRLRAPMSRASPTMCPGVAVSAFATVDTVAPSSVPTSDAHCETLRFRRLQRNLLSSHAASDPPTPTSHPTS